MSPLLTVVAAALVDGEGRVLVQRRAAGRLAGLWEFPGGKVEPGEGPAAALVRELREELGIGVAAQSLRPFSFASAPVEDRHLLLLLFRCTTWSGNPAPLMATQLAWHRPGELARLEMPALDRPLVAALVAASPEGERARHRE